MLLILLVFFSVYFCIPHLCNALASFFKMAKMIAMALLRDRHFFRARFGRCGPIHEKALIDYLEADRIGHLQERGLLAVALAAGFLHDDAGGRVWRGRWLRDLVVAWGSVRECF